MEKLIARFVPNATNASTPNTNIKNILIGPKGIPTNPAKYPETKRQKDKKIKFIILISIRFLAFQSSYQVHIFDFDQASEKAPVHMLQ